MTKPLRIPVLSIRTTQGEAGQLMRDSQFIVRYKDKALKRPDLAISLTMPPRPEGWKSNQIPPVLAMNLPEGFLLHRVLERYQKALDLTDEMNLLAVTSTPASGRVWTHRPEDPPLAPDRPIALRDILAYKGTEHLFDELLDRYGTAPISGVQPKVVVPEESDAADVFLTSSAKSPDLIVKAAGPEYAGLPENEYICMAIARGIGLNTPDFWLSDDRKVFVVRRFDMGPSGFAGFEDMAALTGRHPSKKYHGSYGDIARAVADFAAARNVNDSLEELFRLLVLNCVLRNGDAHLKNFGILYGDPSTAQDDAKLAPAYDLVCTTVYIKRDVLALSLAGDRAWPDRRRLERFGVESCAVGSPGRLIDDVIERTLDFKYEDQESDMWLKVSNEIRLGIDGIQTQRRVHRTA